MTASRSSLAYLALVFLSGLLIGGTVMNLAEHLWLHAHPREERDIRQHHLIAAEMGRRLKLTDAQTQQVDQILQQTVEQYDALEQNVRPQFDQIRRQNRERLRSILNPEQRAEFDRIVEEVDARYPINERSPALPTVSGQAPDH
jgi:hypothetical protein